MSRPVKLKDVSPEVAITVRVEALEKEMSEMKAAFAASKSECEQPDSHVVQSVKDSQAVQPGTSGNGGASPPQEATDPSQSGDEEAAQPQGSGETTGAPPQEAETGAKIIAKVINRMASNISIHDRNEKVRHAGNDTHADKKAGEIISHLDQQEKHIDARLDQREKWIDARLDKQDTQMAGLASDVADIRAHTVPLPKACPAPPGLGGCGSPRRTLRLVTGYVVFDFVPWAAGRARQCRPVVRAFQAAAVAALAWSLATTAFLRAECAELRDEIRCLELSERLMVDSPKEQETARRVRCLWRDTTAHRAEIDSLRGVARRKESVFPLP